jgi:hypothetical protein
MASIAPKTPLARLPRPADRHLKVEDEAFGLNLVKKFHVKHFLNYSKSLAKQAFGRLRGFRKNAST